MLGLFKFFRLSTIFYNRASETFLFCDIIIKIVFLCNCLDG